MEFLSNEKEKIEKIRREGGVYDFKYGQYIIDEIHNITIMYMEVYKE